MIRDHNNPRSFDAKHGLPTRTVTLNHFGTLKAKPKSAVEANAISERDKEFFAPLYEVCAANGIKKKMARQLAMDGLLDVFYIGKKPYVKLKSLRTLPMRCKIVATFI